MHTTFFESENEVLKLKFLKITEYLIVVICLLFAYLALFLGSKNLDFWWATAIPVIVYILLSHLYSGRPRARGSKKISLFFGSLAGLLCLTLAYIYYDAEAAYALVSNRVDIVGDHSVISELEGDAGAFLILVVVSAGMFPSIALISIAMLFSRLSRTKQ